MIVTDMRGRNKPEGRVSGDRGPGAPGAVDEERPLERRSDERELVLIDAATGEELRYFAAGSSTYIELAP